MAPDGERYWPSFRVSRLTDMAPMIRQLRLMQTDVEQMKLLAVVDEPPSSQQEADITRYLQDCFHDRIRCEFEYVDRIERNAGKFEDFHCLVGS